MHVTSGDIGGQLVRQHIRARACKINIAINIHGKRVDCLLPIGYFLNFIEEEIEPFPGQLRTPL